MEWEEEQSTDNRLWPKEVKEACLILSEESKHLQPNPPDY